MNNHISITILQTPESFEQATDVEIAVWGLSQRDAIPSSMFRAITLNGGILLGAHDGESLIGIAFAFPTFRNERRILWSHLTGVLRRYQGQGIGEKLKLAQREWAIQQDFDEIRWTFDPLQRGNANFNLARLGVHADTYHVNLYGDMTDAINVGMPSDRVEAAWDLRKDVKLPVSESIDDMPLALRIGEDSLPEGNAVEASAKCYLVAIPESVAELRARNRELALRWRLALRETLVQAFQQGFAAVDFVKLTRDNAHAYVLAKLQR